MNSNRFNLLLLFYLLSSQLALPQNRDNLHFKNISTGMGLSNKMVLSIQQDTTGFIWIGTAEGLNRYDGYEFKVYKHIPGDSTSLSASWVNCILLTKSGDLWIGTEKGISIYNPLENTFTSCNVSNDTNHLLDNLRIRSLYEDRNGIIWVGTLEGLIKIDQRSNSMSYFTFVADQNQRMANEIRGMHESKNGFLWIATFDGLYRMNIRDNSFERFEVRRGLPHDPINTLVSDIYISDKEPDRLYIATSQGLTIIDEESGRMLESYRTEYSEISDNDVKSINRFDDSHLILATANGISLFNVKTGEFEKHNSNILDKTSLPNETVWCIHEDKLGNIWLGTSNGIAILDKRRKPINFLNVISSENNQTKLIGVNDILVTSNSESWLTYNEGILRYDKNKNLIRKYKGKDDGISHPIVKRILQDSRGIIWIGTNDGVNYYDPGSDRFRSLDKDVNGIPLKYIYDLKEDKDGDIVANISSGICFISPQITTDNMPVSFKYKTAMIDKIITSVNYDVTYFDIDEKGCIWIGTINEGLFRYDKAKDKFTQYKFDDNNVNSINSNRIYSIRTDINGKIWIGTDMGLCLFDDQTESFTRFNDDSDLSGSIRTLTSDMQGRLWIGEDNKLIMFDHDKNLKIIVDLYDDVGLMGLEFNSFFNMENETILLGGNGGVIYFQPGEIVLNMDKAPVVLTNLELWGKSLNKNNPRDIQKKFRQSLSSAKKIVLNHEENSFKLSFAMLNFSTSANNKYAYMLEGYDEKMIVGESGENYVYYSNLPPGNYTFWVKGINSDGIWNDQVASIHILIKTPWWKTWWAYSVLLFVISIILYYTYKLTINRLALRNELRMEKIERGRVEELGRIKMSFFTNISHELKTPLSLILGPIESLKESLNSDKQRIQLDIMKQNAERLLRLINQIMDVRKVENEKMTLILKHGEFISFIRRIFDGFGDYASRRNMTYIFDSHVETKYIFFDSDKIEKILYNLISNAIKYTPNNGHIQVSINEKERYLVVSVRDSGIGVNEEDKKQIFDNFYQAPVKGFDNTYGTGIGLYLTKEFVQLHGGEISLVSQLGKGSEFEFTIPTDLLPAHAQNEKTENFFDAEMDSSDHFLKNKVLVIEDNDDMIEFLKINLEDHYEVITANNGEKGLQLVNENLPDLVISDIMMPGMDGFEVCSCIKENIITSHIPVILLTAKNDEMSRSEGYNRGADSYIYKPFSIKTLRVRIDKMIELRERMQQTFRQKILTEPAEIMIESENDQFINSLMDIIEKNMEDPDFGTKELCEKTNYSYQQIYRKIKALTGETINEFIRRVRLKRARQYLLQSDLRVSEIMYKVGFNSHSYFTKCFREYYGVAPTEYIEEKEK
jgi:signal transduction histidine kinase/ligand-binding sensor domain-containing protein/AraC-like DNA-binding protein